MICQLYASNHLHWTRYVQMLERQHNQLIAGLHEMYKHLQTSEGKPGAKLELSTQNGSQPLTHQILEALGVLHPAPQDDAEDQDGEWQTFEHHPQDDGMMYTSAAASPSRQITFSPMQQTLTQPAMLSHPSIMDRRCSKYDTDPQRVEQYMAAMPPLNTLIPHLKQGPSYSANMAYSRQQLQEFPNFQVDKHMGLGDNTSGRGPGVMDVDWTGMEDMFDNNNPLLAQTVQTG